MEFACLLFKASWYDVKSKYFRDQLFVLSEDDELTIQHLWKSKFHTIAWSSVYDIEQLCNWFNGIVCQDKSFHVLSVELTSSSKLVVSFVISIRTCREYILLYLTQVILFALPVMCTVQCVVYPSSKTARGIANIHRLN